VVAAGLVWLWELPVSNYLRTGTWNWGQVRVWCTVILVILVPLLLFSGFRSEWLDNTLPLQWDNDEVWEPGFIQYCISWSWLWCVFVSFRDAGGALVVGVDWCRSLVMADSSFAISALYYDDITIVKLQPKCQSFNWDQCSNLQDAWKQHFDWKQNITLDWHQCSNL